MRLFTSSSSRPVVREKLACGSIDPSVSRWIIIENQRRGMNKMEGENFEKNWECNMMLNSVPINNSHHKNCIRE